MIKEIGVDPSNNIKGKAEFYRIGLILGVQTVSDVVEWADSEIQRQDRPPYIFIEISLMGHAHVDNVILKLAEFPGIVDKLQVVRKVLPKLLGPMYQKLYQHPEHGKNLANRLYEIYFQILQDLGLEFGQMPKDLEPMRTFDDMYDVAEHASNNYKQETFELFLAFLKRYSEGSDDSL